MSFEYPTAPPIASGDRSASAHLAWLETQRDAIRRAQAVICLILGGSYTLTDPTTFCMPDTGQPLEAQPTPTLSIGIAPTFAFCRYVPVLTESLLISAAFVPPSVADRVDFVGINVLTQELYVISGEEGDTTTPTPPDPDTTTPPLFPICAVYHRPGETCIKNADDSTNGYIIDLRPLPTT